MQVKEALVNLSNFDQFIPVKEALVEFIKLRQICVGKRSMNKIYQTLKFISVKEALVK